MTNQKSDNQAYDWMTCSATTGTLEKACYSCFVKKIETTCMKEDATSNCAFLHAIVLEGNHNQKAPPATPLSFPFCYLSLSMRAMIDCYLLIPMRPKSYDLLLAQFIIWGCLLEEKI
jgi:hypothetical protein